ncbi:TetR family transcriptional regulator [Amycolatopsis acidicola]|uniref:TetR family transcriptional regulator n=1 Tax=Amycolatopsis acidicola TaxID=2596893 RepID=A0A5N0V075_9PSEU|nr:TetR family transcriptional regulator C-terminal domain-containing protein [Amycolatopsis acidicola]KAA9157159.1 TetR family transcriptional regulator [Amycolatopsis acidicola]
MVRTIDQDARRREIVDAVWRLLERSGFQGASVRGVAAETGLSAGSIRHFFRTQAELHEFALTSLSERVAARVRQAAEEPDVRRRVSAMLAEFLPLRDDTARELGIWLEFVHHAKFDPALAAVLRKQNAEMQQFFRRVVADLRELGSLGQAGDLDEVAAGLAAYVNGLTLNLLTSPELITREQAARLLEAYLFGAGT